MIGPMEQKLIKEINNRKKILDGLKVKIVVDAARTTRSEAAMESVKQLQPFASVYLFEVPRLRGGFANWREKVAKFSMRSEAMARWREAFGVWHMKLYIFDDVTIISGANLSETYFTNRTDRYFLIENAKLADFYDGFLQEASSYCLDLEDIKKPRKIGTWDASKYISNNTISLDTNTQAQPVFQMKTIGIEEDELATIAALKHPNLTVATGYLNLPEKYINLLNHSTVVTASPESNGWFNARGIASRVPSLYSAIARDVLRKWEKRTGSCNQILEYNEKDFSFHSKGFWYENSNHFVTSVGSSNFSIVFW